ncbi:MAG TPA: hypothetical protein VFY40_22405, partial [Blastocatellia bacterium]|nr:hypothetical protein [Blastocatellia bacterium]
MAQTSEKMTPEGSISIGFSCYFILVYRKIAHDISFILEVFGDWRDLLSSMLLRSIAVLVKPGGVK